MLIRVSALCAFGLALSTASLQAQDLFVLPGAGANNGVLEAFVTNPLTTYRTLDAGVGSFALLPNLDASKFFVVASSTTNSIFTVNGTFLAPTLVASLSTAPSQAIVTPDGTLLVVAAGTVHIFSTASNLELVSGGVSQGSGIGTFAIAASLDSTAIFALGTNGNGTSQLNSINTSSNAVTAALALSQKASAVSVGPNGLVYVSLPNEILEVDPRTLKPTLNGAISVTGTPGPLVFTSDGQYAIGANQALFGNSLLIATLATHTSTDPNLGLPQLTSLQVIGVDSLLALSTQGLYQITISNPVNVIPISVPNLSTGLLAITATNDVPAGTHSTVQTAYLVSSTGLYEYNPASQAVVTEYPIAPNVTPGALSYAVPAETTAESHPATLLAYGTNQTILPGATSQPLVVRVLDPNNLPLSGYSVEFQTNGGSLNSTSAVTGSNGYALTSLNAPATAGVISVTATAGSLKATFSVVVSTTAQTGGSSTLSIIAGQGQLMFADTSTAAGPGYGSPLQVLASDTNGNPIVGLPVTFSIPSALGTLLVNGAGADMQVVNTNAAGVASVDFLSTSLSNNDTQGFLQSLVTASAATTNAVTFYITTVSSSPTPSVYFLSPQPGTSVTGAEGTTLPGEVKAQIVSSLGYGIPNVSLSVSDNANASFDPTVACNAPGGIVLSSSTGLVSCDLTFGPRLGSGTFFATIGYTHTSVPIPFTVTAGAPATVAITQGNNQTGAPGQTLTLALRVHVTDSGGNVVTGAAVSWQVLTAGAVTLSDIIGKTDSNGNASALATLGSIAGVAQVRATAGTASATFSLTVNIPSVGIQKVSGDEQTATVSTAFPLPLIVKVVDSGGNGVAGAQVNFQVTSGTATLGTALATTDSTGQASTTVTAGATAGAITISATSGAYNVSFTLTAQPVGPNNITIVNGASFNPNTGISPGGIATIRGTGILPGVQGLLSAANSAGQLPTTFSGVTISFNGTPAPIYYVEDTNGADQVSVQVPFEVEPGPAVALTVNVANLPPATVMVPVKPLAPGIFTSIYGGKTYAVAVRPDGSQVSPTNPAQRGENIQLYVTGLGQATPTIATGAAGVPDQTMLSSLIVGLDNGGVHLIDSVYGPGLIGIYIVTIQVPANAATGPYQPVGIIGVESNGTLDYAQATYIPIE
jgi:large repetitive protein